MDVGVRAHFTTEFMMNLENIERLMKETKTDGYPEDLIRFACAIEAEEREECAKLCEAAKVNAQSYFEINERLDGCASEIRMRSNA